MFRSRVTLCALFLLVAPSACRAAQQEVDYARLSESAVAAAIKLTDEQKAAITTIVKERDAALSSAEEDAKPGILSGAAEKLAAVLNTDQQALFQSLFSGTRIRFNFRAQKWADVLDYIADEAGLSLVMNDAPAGVFNYSDSKEYTPTEAVDLINGWLLTKGFTLIRRERLLMCLPIRDGLPENAIPRVSVEELPTRGRFELVSVLIPLEGRPAEAASKEVQAIAGTYSRVTPLPATGQLMVTDTAHTVRSMLALINAIPKPKAPAPPKKPTPKPPAPKPPAPVIEVHPIRHANPDKVGEVLGKFVSGTILVDAAANQITISAIPAAQDTARSIIKRLEDNQGPDKQPLLKLYPIRSQDTDSLSATIGLAAPAAQLRFEDGGRTLVAWATPKEHAKVESVLKELSATAQRAQGTQLERYTIRRVSPSAAIALLSELLPDARMTADDNTNAIVVVGSLADHQAVRALIDQIESDPAGKRTLKTYDVRGIPSATVTTLASTFAPSATVSFDDPAESALIVASDTEHELLSPALERLRTSAESRRSELRIYPVGDSDAAGITTMLSTIVPGASVTTGPRGERLVVIASVKDHTAVENLLQQVAANPTNEPELKAYDLPEGQPVDTINALLTSLVPTASVTVDSANGRLLVVAPISDHERVARTLELAARPDGRDLKLQFHPVDRGMDVSSVVALLNQLVPDASVHSDANAGRLVVVATASDQTQVTDILKQVADTAEAPRELKPYLLPAGQAAEPVTTLLSTLAPDASVTVDEAAGRLLVVAGQAEHQIVAATLEQLSSTAGQLPELRFYPVAAGVDSGVATVLSSVAPAAQITADEANRRLSIVANAADHERIKATLTKLELAAAANEKPGLRIYQVTSEQRRRFTDIATGMTEQLPGLQLITSAEPRELTVWATPSQQQAVAQVLEQLKLDIPEAERPSLVVYPVTKVDVAGVQTVLAELFPDATITADEKAARLLIKAVPAEHKAIDAAVKQLDNDAPVSTRIKLMAYPVDGLTSTTVVSLISAELPDVTVIEDTAAETVIVRGRVRDHEKVASIIDALRTTAGSLRQRRVVVYPAVLGTTATTVDFITTAFPGTRAVVDPNSRRLTVWATEAQHREIAAAVSAMSGANGGELAPTTESYAIRGVDSTSLIQMLSQAVPDAKVVASTDGTRLVAWARTADQDTIRSIIAGSTAGSGENRHLEIFEVTPENLATVRQVLETAHPDITFMDSPTGNALLAWVDDEQTTAVTAMVKQVESNAAISGQRTLTVFKLGDAGASAARQLLTTAYPEVTFVDSPDGSSLIAHVKSDQAAAIRATLEQLQTHAGLTSDRALEIYDITLAGGDAARSVLTATVPNVSFTGSGSKLTAWVLPAEHAKIQATLKQLEAAQPFKRDVAMKSYSTRGLGPDAQSVLQTAVPGASILATADPTQLMIRATAHEHRRITETLAQLREFAGNTPQRSLATFDIEGLDPDSVQQTLAPLLDDDVQMTVDPVGRRLFVRAFPDKQEKIREVVDTVIKSLPSRKGVTTKVYHTRIGDADEVEEVATELFPDAVIRADADRKVIVATALPEEQERIKAIVEQMMSGDDGAERKALTYPLRTADGEGLEDTLQSLFRRGDVRVSYDAAARSLLVVASEEQHAVIKSLVDQVESSETPQDDRTVEFYSLDGADGDAVQNVVQDLLDVIDPKASVVNDDGSRQLVVTTIADGHRKVKDAIERLQSRDDPREFEVFQLQRLEASSAELAVTSMFDDGLTAFRDQPLVQSDDESQQLLVRGTADQIDQIRSLLIKMGETGLRGAGDANPKVRVIPINGDARTAIESLRKVWPRIRPNPIRVLQPGAAGVRQLTPPAEPTDPPPADCSGQDGPVEEAPQQDAKPILLVPGNGRITISSDDTDALDQMEAVLRAVFSGSARTNRDFSVYALSNAAASSVGDLLNNIFGRNNSPVAFGNVVIVPDQRLNALIVFAGRKDRERIEQLIEILDSDDTPDTLATHKTRVIEIKNADANRIHTVLTGIYKAQMTAGGARQQVSIPRGVPSEVATVLRQINAASSSPLLNVQVEETTNSLIVMAPQNLLEEVTSLIDDLDKAAARSRARGVSIIELQKTNSKRVMEVLDRVLKK